MPGRTLGFNAAGNYGKGVVELDDVELGEARLAEDLVGVVRETFKSDAYAPPVLPAAALELHQMARQPDVELNGLLAVLEKDPLLAARVLKVAASPLYGGRPVQSLSEAVIRLGLANLSDVVWQVALNMKVFRSKAYAGPMELVRRHSVAVAHLSRTIAKMTPVPLDYAFLCGLLHDAGAAAIFLLLEADAGRKNRPYSSDVLAMVLKACHAEASAIVAGAWQLPADVGLVLGHHHTVEIAGYAHPTAAIIAFAEQVLSQVELGEGPPWAPDWDTTSDVAWLASAKALQLSDQALRAIRKDTAKLLERLGESV